MAFALGEHALDGRIVDAYEYAVSLFSRVAADGYIRMVKTLPSLYGFLYDRVERAREPGSLRNWLGMLSARNLQSLIAGLQPCCVVCTHAFGCGIMSHYKRTIDPSLPVIGVVTDYVVHPFWIYRNIDAYAVATEEMRAALVERGVDERRVRVTGIPVDPRFALIPPKAQARHELGIDAAGRRVVLIMAGGLGIGPLETMLRALREVRRPLSAVVLVGKNERRRIRLRRWCRSWPYPVEIRGFEENVYDYMHAADVLLTKPGGLSLSEALVARLPMMLVKPLGGQEERNMRYVLSQGAALFASTEAEIAAATRRLLDRASERRRLLERAECVRRPEAAADVAAIVRDIVAYRPQAVSATGLR